MLPKLNYRIFIKLNKGTSLDTAGTAKTMKAVTPLTDLYCSILEDFERYPRDMASHSGHFVSVGVAFVDKNTDPYATWRALTSALTLNGSTEGDYLYEDIILEMTTDLGTLRYTNDVATLRYTNDVGTLRYTNDKHNRDIFEPLVMHSRGPEYLPGLSSMDGMVGLVLGATGFQNQQKSGSLLFVAGNLDDSLINAESRPDGLYLNTSHAFTHDGKEIFLPKGQMQRHITY